MAFDLTCGNRLEVSPRVNERKVLAMSEMLKGINAGGFTGERAAIALKEALSTSDAPYSFSHLLNIRNLPDFDKAPRQWTKIASVLPVDNFLPQTFYTLRTNFDNLKYGKGVKTPPRVGVNVSPKVAEGDTYQSAFGYSEEQVKTAIEKRGFLFDITLERILSDLRPIVRQMPGDMLEVALDTDEFLVFDALQTKVNSSSQLQGGTAPITNVSVPVNSPLTADALRRAFYEISQRVIYNRQVVPANGYQLVVPIGAGEFAQAMLDAARAAAFVVTPEGSGQIWTKGPATGNLGRINGVIESFWINQTSTWWALVPDAGTTRRPSLVKLELTGRTAPELMVHNFTGMSLSGGGSSPFDLASFENDSVTLKLRQFTNGDLLDQSQIVWSNGSGS